MKEVAILQSGFLAPDWSAIRELSQEEAANSVAKLLRSLDKAEKVVFATRGMALLIIEERSLWEGRADSMGQWIKHLAPNSWSDCYAAMRTVKELLPDIPLDDLRDMKRCNIEEVKKLSSAVRRDPKVIEAAKDKTRSEFLIQTSRDHPDQHLSLKSKWEEALDMCELLEGCSRKQAEEIIAEFYIAEHAAECIAFFEEIKP